MRTVVLAALAGLAIFAVGCDRQDGGELPGRPGNTAVVEPEMPVDVVPQEDPAVARSQWRAATDEARRVTGNLRVSIEAVRGGPVIFAFANGITVRAQPYNVVPADSRSGVGGQSFAAVLGGDPRVSAHLYRVLDENVTRSAAQGGLCGEERTRYMAVSEFVDSTGRWVFKVAAFRGADALPVVDPGLCNSYAYIAQ